MGGGFGASSAADVDEATKNTAINPCHKRLILVKNKKGNKVKIIGLFTCFLAMSMWILSVYSDMITSRF